MPLKDLTLRAAYARAQYLKNKDEFYRRSKERRLRQRAEKAAAQIGPKKPPQRTCRSCGADITYSYKPKHGHNCAACNAEYQKAYRQAKAQHIAESKKQWKLRNSAHVKAKDRAYAEEHPDRRAAARARWDARNPGVTSAAKSKNRAERIKRIPTWLSEDDKWMIAQAHDIAQLRTKLFGFAWHVDHVIPLKGKMVSGLHTPYNLQVIPAKANVSKNNRYEVL
jgi:hypothetical protein